MTDDPEHVQVNHKVPRHVREAAQSKTNHGELSEMVRGLYRRVAFGEDVAEHETVKKELERIRDRKDQARQEIRAAQAKLETIEQKETRLEEKLSQHTSREDRYEGHLESLESLLAEGSRIFPEHPGVERAANVAEVEPTDVIADLQERNPNVPDYAFEVKTTGTPDWTGFGSGGTE